MRDMDPVRRVLLVGFMGSGKTRVGRVLARRLGWAFRDFDQEVASRLGLPIAEIFRQHGEAAFRQMEERVGAELLSLEGVVLASGGGWPAGPGRMESLPPGTFSVWLRVSVEEALRRTREEGPVRPLLAVEGPTARAGELMGLREPRYGMADVALDTEKVEPEELARRIEDVLNRRGRVGTPPLSPQA